MPVASIAAQPRVSACLKALRPNFQGGLNLGCRAPQPELARVLWPVFMHVYLELIRRGAAAPAHGLLARHRPRFAGAPGEQPLLPHAQVRLCRDTPEAYNIWSHIWIKAKLYYLLQALER